MSTRFCQRCGSCILGGSVAVAEITRPGAVHEATVLCDDCCHVVRGHLQPLPERAGACAATFRAERAPVPTRGGLDRGPDSFSPLVGRYRDVAPIRRRST
jgi:hypothetical protein